MAPPHTNHRRTDPEYNHLLNFLIEKAKDAKSPISIKRTAKEFKEKSGAAQTKQCFEHRMYKLRTKIHTFAHIDAIAYANTKVKLLFALSASVDANFLKKLKKEALVEVDEKNRIKKYEAIDGSLKLNGDHSQSAKTKTAMIGSKRSHQKSIRDYFESKNKADVVPKNKIEKEMWNLIEFVIEKCENVISPLTILRLAKDFNKKFRTSRPLVSIFARIRRYCREIQRVEYLDTHSKVKQLFGLSATVDLDCLEKLRKTAVLEVDHKNRIIRYMSNDNSLTLRGSHWGSRITEPRSVEKRNKNNVAAMANDLGEESDNEVFNDSSQEYSSEEIDSEFDADDENFPLDEAEDRVESLAVDFDNDTSARDRSPTEMSIDDNFDFDPPTERSNQSEEIEMREDVDTNSGITGNTCETLPKNKISSSTSHTPKRKTDASDGSSSSKRPRTLSDESMNSGKINDNSSHDDHSRVELEPFHGPLGLPNETQKDSDIQQIPNPHPQVMEAPIKKEYEEEDQTLLKPVLKSFKSLILGLDTPGLMQLQVELDTKIEKTGRGIEVSNKEMIMAIELLVVKLSKHGALKSSEDSISLRDFLLMLRMILLNPSFNGLEDILKMLKENIDQLKDLDKKVPVSKVDSVLRATIARRGKRNVRPAQRNF